MAIEEDDEMGISIIMTDSVFVCSAWEQEAKILGRDRRELAEERMKVIADVIVKYRKDYTKSSIAKGIIFAIVATGIFLLIFTLVSRLRDKEMQLVEKHVEGKKIFGILEGENILLFNQLIMRLFQVVTDLWVFIIYLNLVLSFFPWTFNISAILYDWITTPLKLFWNAFVEQLPDFFALGIIILITRYVIKGIRQIFDQVSAGTLRIQGFYSDWAGPTYGLVRLVVLVFAAVAAWPYIPGSESPAFKGISIFIGVLFSLGSTSVVGNISAGMVLTYMRPFSKGDYIQINDIKGILLDRRTFSTRILTLKNERITIPNLAVAGNPIINFSRRAKKEGVVLYVSVTIGYDVPWRTVQGLLLKAAEQTDDVLKDPPPFVLKSALEDFYVRYELNVTTRNPERGPHIHDELHEHILDNFAEVGVEIMSPHYQHNRTGNESAIPILGKGATDKHR
jgi:small-conductance mechanosensitive channel